MRGWFATGGAVAALWLAALGVQIAGVHSEWIGATLFATGLGIAVLSVTWPLARWLWRRLAAAMLRAALASGVSLGVEERHEDAEANEDLEDIRQELADLQQARAVELEGIGNRRQLRAAIQNLNAELIYNRRLIEEAIHHGQFWDGTRRQLVADQWNRHRDMLAGEPLMDDAFQNVQRAFAETDRLNHAEYAARHPRPGGGGFVPGVFASSATHGMNRAIREIDTAMASLEDVLNRLRDQGGPAA